MTPTERSTRAGRYSGPPGDDTVYLLPRDMTAWEKAWGLALPAITDDETGERQPVDMSPEAVAERARRKALHAEAMAFISSYTGTFGLILDIRANPKYGTKYLKLSDRQVDAVLASRDRDAAMAASRAGQAAVVERVADAIRSGPAPDFVVSIVAQYVSGRALSERQLDVIDAWATGHQKPAPGTEPAARATEGMYKLPDGTIAKVQKAVHGSGNLYAKQLVVEEGSTSGRFEYAPGLISRIRPEDRMSLDEAAAFGKLYGWCCVCGRTLTDEKSIAAGIGPVCAAKV